MNKQKRYDNVYLNMTLEWAKLSHCTRKKVGALIVKDGMIISDGYNGSPKNMDNNCEDCDGNTIWYVIHAEENAILKCSKHGQSCDGATIYQTHSPCRKCSILIFQSGIKRVVYLENYKDTTGIDFLREQGIDVEQFIK